MARRESDFDGKPGNSSDSAAYDRMYDPRNEQERGNRTESPNLLEQFNLENRADRERELARNAILDAQNQVKFWPSAGKFIIPKENSWAAHSEIVRNDEAGLYFFPDKYPHFDKIIAQKTGGWISKPEFEGLRTNLEVLRNDIIGIYLQDGSFDPGDEVFLPCLHGIAEEIGNLLANSNAPFWKKPFVKGIDLDVANMEGVGAQEIYKHLLSVQEPRGMGGRIQAKLKELIGFQNRAWDLPPLSQTPFSDANLAAPSPSSRISKEPGAQPAPGRSVDETMADLGQSMVATASRLNSVDSLRPPTKEESVEEGRKILRRLRNLEFGDNDLEEWLDLGAPEQKLAKAEMLGKLLNVYSGQLHDACARDNCFLDHAGVQDAHLALGALAQGVAEQSLKLLPPDHPKVAVLEHMLSDLPHGWEVRQMQSPRQLLDTIESALERATQQQVSDVPVGERMLHTAERANANARRFQNVEEMQPPAREESIELAREILRRLKNMSLSDKTLAGLVNDGKPEDQLAIAQQAGHMLGLYNELLAQAKVLDPSIVQREEIKEAAETAGAFGYGISLMAAKELPGSAAATQQISAATSQSKGQWENLSGRTISRLMQTMDRAIEAVSQAIEQSQQQSKSSNVSSDQAESQRQEAEQQNRSSRRSSRRSRRATGAGLTRSASRRNAGDLNGDGIADSQQGMNPRGNNTISVREPRQQSSGIEPMNAPRSSSSSRSSSGSSSSRNSTASTPRESRSSNPTKSSPPSINLKNEDMATLKALTDSLSKANKSASGMAPLQMTDVKVGDKIRPDDSMALREQEKLAVQRAQKNNKII